QIIAIIACWFGSGSVTSHRRNSNSSGERLMMAATESLPAKCGSTYRTPLTLGAPESAPSTKTTFVSRSAISRSRIVTTVVLESKPFAVELNANLSVESPYDIQCVLCHCPKPPRSAPLLELLPPARNQPGAPRQRTSKSSDPVPSPLSCCCQ